jgi:hypothetical protein
MNKDTLFLAVSPQLAKDGRVGPMTHVAVCPLSPSEVSYLLDVDLLYVIQVQLVD